MTISNPISRHDYVATAGQTTFPYSFRLLEASHMEVLVNAAKKTLTTDYTITNVGNPAGGNVVFNVGLALNDKVVLLSTPTITQQVDYLFNDKFPESAHEDGLDKLTLIGLMLREQVGRAIKFSKHLLAKDIDIVDAPVAGGHLGYDATATKIITLANLQGPKGDKGDKGDQGPAGSGLSTVTDGTVTVNSTSTLSVDPAELAVTEPTGGTARINMSPHTGDANVHHAQLHKDAHKSGGGDALASTDLIEAIIKRIQTSTGPTTMLVGAVADGQFIRRSGTNLIGDTPVAASFDGTKLRFQENFTGVDALTSGARSFAQSIWQVDSALVTNNSFMEFGSGEHWVSGLNGAGLLIRPWLASKNPTFVARCATFLATNATYHIGLMEQSGTSHGDGILFRTVRSGGVYGNIFAVCREADVETTLDLGIIGGDGAMRTLKFVVTGGNSVEFFVDGVSKGSITTNTPAGSMTIEIGNQHRVRQIFVEQAL